jgi:hypothetical protein
MCFRILGKSWSMPRKLRLEYELLERIGDKKGAQHHGREMRESDEQKPRRLIAEMLRKLEWTERDLVRRPK